MHNLILAILCSVAVSVLLKVARKKNIIIEQAIAFNYIVAISLSYFLLKPDFKGLEFTEYLAQSDSTPIFLALGILLPTVFIIMSKAVEFAGIVRSDAAQRLSLFLPIVASFIIFHETLSQPKIVGIIFYVCVLFAGMSSLVNLYEAPVATIQEKLKLNRVASVGIITVAGCVVSLVIQGIVSGWMDAVSIYICPLGAMLAAIMFFWVAGKKFAVDAVNAGADKPIGKWFVPLGKYVLVPLSLVALIAGALLGGIG